MSMESVTDRNRYEVLQQGKDSPGQIGLGHPSVPVCSSAKSLLNSKARKFSKSVLDSSLVRKLPT